MSDIWELRDPSQPCEHPLDPEAMYDGAFLVKLDGQWWDCGQCPGGKKVKLRKVDHPHLPAVFVVERVSDGTAFRAATQVATGGAFRAATQVATQNVENIRSQT